MVLSKLILYSPKLTLVFQQCKQEMSIEGSGLRPLCPTRWTVRTGALDVVMRNYIYIYVAIVEALQEIYEVSHDDYGWRANGLLSQLEKFAIFFGLKLAYLVFSGAEQTSINLQWKDASVQEAVFVLNLQSII